MKQIGILCLRIIPLPLILCSFMISNFALPSVGQGRETPLGQTIPDDQSNSQHLPLIKTAPSVTGDQALVFVSRQIPQM